MLIYIYKFKCGEIGDLVHSPKIINKQNSKIIKNNKNTHIFIVYFLLKIFFLIMINHT